MSLILKTELTFLILQTIHDLYQIFFSMLGSQGSAGACLGSLAGHIAGPSSDHRSFFCLTSDHLTQAQVLVYRRPFSLCAHCDSVGNRSVTYSLPIQRIL